MKNSRRTVLLVTSIMILVNAIPLSLWCFTLLGIKNIDGSSTLIPLGCLIGICIYLYSILVGIIGIIGYKKGKYRLARISAILGLVLCVIDTIFLKGYVLFTLLPLVLLLIAYLVGTKEKGIKSNSLKSSVE